MTGAGQRAVAYPDRIEAERLGSLAQGQQRPRRRATERVLLHSAVDYAVAEGLADLTLRPLADALGVMPNTLVHHFGSKEKLLSAILNGVRDRLRAMRAQMESDGGETPLKGVWEWTSDTQRLPFFRSFFEAYGLALHQPERYRAFLDRVISDWLAVADVERATLELAVVRGLLLDLLTTGERDRVDAAFALFLARAPLESV
jgi:AcrR family transcriptional regulator